jgi:hypothetical protein
MNPETGDRVGRDDEDDRDERRDGADFDDFDVVGIRHRVLAAWSASPARFREDANAEEDLVLGGYRDRVIVELAQNAADAAARSGRPGRLLLALREDPGGHGPGVLVAANTGSALDAAGVQALATLRASAKRDGDTVGRFGVGFAAVLAVSDEPAVVGRPGGVRFSAADTRDLVRGAALSSPGLAEELLRRDEHVPVLRLPFAAVGTAPEGYDTAVLLPLRDAAAAELVVRLLDEVGDPLLLALPALAEIVVERPGLRPVVLREVGERWHVRRRSGRLPAAVLAGRPVEERDRDRWEVTWALPRDDRSGRAPAADRFDEGDGSGPALPTVVHAPTPSDEPLPWPALLIATLPLDPSRRHVADGPVTAELVREAARTYADLLTERAEAGEPAWPRVMTGLPAGPIDRHLRDAVAQLLPGCPILPSALDPGVLLRPRDAVALAGPAGADPATVAGFASWLVGLVLAPRAAGPALDLLGVRRISLADAVEGLPPVADPARWREIYSVLAPLAGDAAVREALAFLPVPLADGSVVRGMRGLLLAPPDDAGLGPALAVLGARVVHPAAAHPLLERLGAVPAGPRALVELDPVRAAVTAPRERLDELPGEPGGGDDPQAVVDAVLTLVSAAVRAGQLAPGDLPWLGDLELADSDGEPTPADALALPGSPAAQWFPADEVGVVAAGLLERWGEPTLAAVGVLHGVGRLTMHDVPLDEEGVAPADGPDPAAELDGWDDWLAVLGERGGLGPDAVLGELIAVRDLDLVRPEALPEVVAHVAADPGLRPALVAPARVTGAGAVLDVPSYTAWWLRTELFAEVGVLAGPDAEPQLLGLLPAAPDWVAGLDPVARRALGVLTSVDDLDALAVPALLAWLAREEIEVAPELLVTVLARVAELAAEGLELERPERLRVVSGITTEVVAADEAVVVESPMYRQRPDLGGALPVSPDHGAALADLLDLPMAGELANGQVREDGEEQPTAAEIRRLLPQAPARWYEHDQLVVDGVEVDWWVQADGGGVRVHAATTDGLARALAWAAGRWDLRSTVAGLLYEPETAADVVVDQVFSERPNRSRA